MDVPGIGPGDINTDFGSFTLSDGGLNSGGDVDIRAEKVRRIFKAFDKNGDDRLNKEEMAELVVAVNPNVRFSDDQIAAILEEVFRTYGDFIDEMGLTLDGLTRTYDDGAGDVDRDFNALGLSLTDPVEPSATEALLIEEDVQPEDWIPPLSEEANDLMRRLEEILQQYGGVPYEDMDEERRMAFCNGIQALRDKANKIGSIDDAFAAHMAMGQKLADRDYYDEALLSFYLAAALREDGLSQFRIANTQMKQADYIATRQRNQALALAKLRDAEQSFEKSIMTGRAQPQYKLLLPKCHLNLGVALELQGLLMAACEQYRAGVELCPSHHRGLKLLGSGLLGLGESYAAEQALAHSIYLEDENADAHCDHGTSLKILSNIDKATSAYKRALAIDPAHKLALANLGALQRNEGLFGEAIHTFEALLSVDPNEWLAHANIGVCLLGVGRADLAREEFDQAYAMAFQSAQVMDLLNHLRHLRALAKHYPNGLHRAMRFLETNPVGEKNDSVMLPYECFELKDPDRAESPASISVALEMRGMQGATGMQEIKIAQLKAILAERKALGRPGLKHSPVGVERLLHSSFVSLESFTPRQFMETMKILNVKVVQKMPVASEEPDGAALLDVTLFLAAIAAICSGTREERIRFMFECLATKAGQEMQAYMQDMHVLVGLLQDVYLPKHIQPYPTVLEDNAADLGSFLRLSALMDLAFPFLQGLEKLEQFDKVVHKVKDAVTGLVIQGPLYQCINKGCDFALSAETYSQGKVPGNVSMQKIYKFIEVLQRDDLSTGGSVFGRKKKYNQEDEEAHFNSMGSPLE
eukprot:jgi/Mesvir1/14923/Mv05516-RA.1